jgi:hypothetical protein
MDDASTAVHPAPGKWSAREIVGLARKTVPRTEPATLDYFMTDYVGHLEHHLQQVLPGST